MLFMAIWKPAVSKATALEVCNFHEEGKSRDPEHTENHCVSWIQMCLYAKKV